MKTGHDSTTTHGDPTPRVGSSRAHQRVAAGGSTPARPRRLALAGALLGAGVALLILAASLLHPKAPEGLHLADDGVLEVPAAVTARVERPELTGPIETPHDGAGDPTDPRPRIRIPAVGINTAVGADLTLRSGDWNPPLYELGRWPDSAPLNGGEGTVMLAGHVWVGQTSGVLANLRNVVPGNLIVLVDDDGAREEFLVRSVEEFPRDALPSWAWGSTTGPRGLVLVTCAGRATDLDGHRTWSRNLVVDTVPANTDTGPNNATNGAKNG